MIAQKSPVSSDRAAQTPGKVADGKAPAHDTRIRAVAVEFNCDSARFPPVCATLMTATRHSVECLKDIPSKLAAVARELVMVAVTSDM